jgi:AcrR family transcriptional regulator
VTPTANYLSKAAMIAEKDRAVVMAAREHFLRDGFAEASMDGIAKSAGVSVKTIYSHFANKDELFSKVMIDACTDHLLSEELPSDEMLAQRFAWFHEATRRGLFGAGREYLRHLLSEEHLALYRVVTRDAARFPELGRQYQKNLARGRTGILTAYFRNVARKKGWATRDAPQDAALYEALLRAGIYEQALHGILTVNPDVIDKHARSSAKTMWKLFTANPNGT